MVDLWARSSAAPLYFKGALRVSLVLLLVIHTISAEAQAAEAKKKKKPAKIPSPIATLVSDTSDIYYANISFKVPNKKPKKGTHLQTEQVACLNTAPGDVTQDASGMHFTPFTEKTRYNNAMYKRTRKVRFKASLAHFNKFLKLGRQACLNVPFNSLDTYEGTFGYAEAARLLRVVGFGAPPEQVPSLVALGPGAAVNTLIDTSVSEPILDAEMRELECDTYFAGEEENRDCDPLDENDLDTSGMRTAYYHWALNTANQFQAKLMLFLNDHVAASFRVLSYCERYAARRYRDMLRQLTQTGDLSAFLYQMVNDPMLAQWLNRYSSTRYNTNEDWGREFLELFTIGKHDLDGNPRYGDTEIIGSSLAFTGLSLVYNDNEDYTSCYLAYSPDLHEPSPKVLWVGTPNETVVYDSNDMVEAVKAHPGLAEYWAYNLIREYVTDNPSKFMVQQAAEKLRANGYNIKELLRVLLKSESFYAAESRGTLYKLPIEYAFDILRSTGMPKPHPRWFLWNLDDLAQEMWNPPTVFGWYTYADSYMNSRYVLERRNLAMDLLDYGEDDLEEEGFDMFTKVLSDQPSAEVLIDRLALQLGVSLNDAQKAALLEFMNYDIEWDGDKVRDAFDSVRGSDNAVWKTIGLWLLLVEQADFQRK